MKFARSLLRPLCSAGSPLLRRSPTSSFNCLSSVHFSAHAHNSSNSSHSKSHGSEHHHEYPEEALPFGRRASDPLEGWEIITGATLLLSAGSVFVYFGMGEEDTVREWAKREYLAREKVIENGGTVEFGKYYQDAAFNGSQVDQMPTIEN